MKHQASGKTKKNAKPRPDPRWQTGLTLLAEARRGADEAGMDPWEYAVELNHLVGAGLNVTDLRRCIDLGWVQHAEECSTRGRGRRRFRPTKTHALGPHECFILTEAGGEALAALQLQQPSASGSDGPKQSVKPRWDRDSRTLTLGDQVVAHLPGRDGIQVEVLDILERQGWPPCVEDFLALLSRSGTNRKKRLHHAVVDLNKRQDPLRIRFHSFAGGWGLRWELVPA